MIYEFVGDQTAMFRKKMRQKAIRGDIEWHA